MIFREYLFSTEGETPLRVAATQGYLACFMGFARTQNPYSFGDLYTNWLAGWRQAFSEAMKEGREINENS